MSSRYRSIFAIGDIHGCNTELNLLLESLPLDRETLVVFLGDYVDRGPESKQVIDTILELRRRIPVVTLRGNHEAMFIDFLEHPESVGAGLFIFNGGSATLASYQTSPGRFEVPEEHRLFLKELRPFFASENYFFVHAGVPPELPLSQVSEEKHGGHLLWIRGPFLSSVYRWEKMIVHGHTPVREPEILKNRINIDTGCVYDRRLTAIELPAQRFYSVEKQLKAQAPVHLRDDHVPGRAAIRFHGSLSVYVEKDGQEKEFETLNYNELGLLIRETHPSVTPESSAPAPSLLVGEVIRGRIGNQTHIDLHFTGVVVRTESRGGETLYGVKML